MMSLAEFRDEVVRLSGGAMCSAAVTAHTNRSGSHVEWSGWIVGLCDVRATTPETVIATIRSARGEGAMPAEAVDLGDLREVPPCP